MSPILTIHLDRFEFESRKFGKVTAATNFPNELDLKEFLIEGFSDTTNTKYDLYAIVLHPEYATFSGSYTAYVKIGQVDGSDEWYEFENYGTKKISLDDVESIKAKEDPYLLFYVNKDWYTEVKKWVP